MTALLELKQKMKILYGRYDTFILPVLKFILAFISFKGINSAMGFMSKLDNVFVVLILSILCAVLPLNAMALIGVGIIIGHCYALGIETAGFALLLMVLLMIMFLRFSSKDNLALILTPVSFGLHIPAFVPVSCGLMRSLSSAIPAVCGVIIYHFMTLVDDKASMLKDPEGDIIQKFKLLLDGLIKNQTMWLTILAFATVIIVVYAIRKLSVDYSWHIAVFVGGVVYIAVMVAGGLFMDVSITMGSVVISTIISVLLGFVLQFFAWGVDYSRTETLQYEDDEYVYYVKAVPKAFVTESKRSIKTINEEPARRVAQNSRNRTPVNRSYVDSKDRKPPLRKSPVADIDFEGKLEESLKDL